MSKNNAGDFYVFSNGQRPTEPVGIDTINALANACREAMLAAFGAVNAFISTDATRGLSDLCIESNGDRLLLFLATDGHTAAIAEVHFVDEHGVPAGCVLVTGDSIKRFATTKGYSPLQQSERSVSDFPEFRNVMDATVRDAGPPVVAVNVGYFARIPAAMVKLGFAKKDAVRWIFGEDELSPVLVTTGVVFAGQPGVNNAKALFVVMPVRME